MVDPEASEVEGLSGGRGSNLTEAAAARRFSNSQPFTGRRMDLSWPFVVLAL